MALPLGTRLGPYEVLSPLGAGGMGEVYRARDTRLGRDVAIKVLPEHLSASPEDRARFQREAKAISALNDPHICVLHDIGREGETDYLVMELVEGETLAQRLTRGPLTIADVLRLGAQIASALERAHRAGVVHRDLKPGNVMLTKAGVKLMDFGLARSIRHAVRGTDDVTTSALDQAAKTQEPITAKGTVVGTYQYMAPEQLEGLPADARSDIWSMGCTLYEMATGKRAFEGATPLSAISAIMREEPRRMADLAPLTPPALERVVRQCLAKDREDRWQTAGDLGRELTWIQDAGSRAGVPPAAAARRGSRERIAWSIVGVALVAVAALLLRPKPATRAIAFEAPPPSKVAFVDLPRISPDGTRLAFRATDSTGISSIWVRQMNELDARQIPGTEGAWRPFWSPDSRYLAFFAGGKLMKIDVTGGPEVSLCSASRGYDGTWSPRGVILFDGETGDSVQMVPASGGTPTAATRLDRSRHETGSAWPQFLPDGRHFLYLAWGQSSDTATLKVGSIDSKDTKILAAVTSRAEFASGRLLYVNGGTLVARPFDARTLEFKGEPIAVAQNVEVDPAGGAKFSASTEGTLVFHSGALSASTRLVWLNRRGERIGTVGGPGKYDMPSLSPNGKQLAVQVSDSSESSSEIWLWDLSRDVGSRFTFANQTAIHPVWSPDGTRLCYGVKHGTGFDLYLKRVGEAGGDSLLYASNEVKDASDWSPDGQLIVYMEYPVEAADRNIDIYAISVTGVGRPIPVVATKFNSIHPALSPDGKWIVYASSESGRPEVYVQSFRGPAGRWRISMQGGIQSFWRADGGEIFYLGLDGGLMGVQVAPGSPPRFSLPHRLFASPAKVRFNTRNEYVPTRDGQRFLFVVPEGRATVGTTTVLVNWPASLAKN